MMLADACTCIKADGLVITEDERRVTLKRRTKKTSHFGS